VASLIEPPPPSSIGDSPAFDLSRWDGDPNDPSLDPLFFAVDRMVNAARTSVGAPVRDDDYDAPPQPAPRPAPRPAPAPPPRQATPMGGDHLGSEAEHWRAIRDSRDPADFMDYLSRYGPQGAFAEVAELRLKQLTAGGAAPRPAPTPAPPPQRAAPPRYGEAPQRREPPRRIDAPMPPPRRAEAPRRMPPPDRGFDRDLREPARDGGALRAIILIAVLGGAALGGGLYFGGGMGNNAPSRQETADISSEPLDVPAGVPLGEPGDVEPPPIQVLDRGTTQVASRAEPTPPATTPRERTPAQPAATTQTLASSNTAERGGPLTLVPPDPGQAPGNVTRPASGGAVPLAPASASAISSTPPSPASNTAANRSTTGSVVWASRPTARRISELYPQRPLREGLGGRVALNCEVLPSMNVSCEVATESPAGQGFGRAALAASSSYRARPTLSDGSSAVGTRTRIIVSFQAPQ
jgi:protein TonB